MAEETRNQLQTYFETGDIPTQEQFYALLDSYIHKIDDGLTVYKPLGDLVRLGINETTPSGTLTINTGKDVESKSVVMFGPGKVEQWNLRIGHKEITKFEGFTVDENTFGANTSRLYIQNKTGYVGLNNMRPIARLHVTDTKQADQAGMIVSNTAASKIVTGWQMGHLNDNTLLDRDGSLLFSSIDQKNVATERIIVTTKGNVGINEAIPDSTLHVTRSLSDPKMPTALMPGTGILMVGPVAENISVDSNSIQARTADTNQTPTVISKASLFLQPLGGSLFIQDPAGTKYTQFSDSGNIGVGITPEEKVHVNGALRLEATSTSGTTDGTIRYTGTDFEGRKAGAWVSLTGSGAGGSYWLSTETDKIYYNTPAAKVGIGTASPASALHVMDDTSVDADNSTAAQIRTSAIVTGTSSSARRVALELACEGTWNAFDSDTFNIGLHVPTVSGQDPNANFAAVLNGNVVIGSTTAGTRLVGTQGTNVLAIQNGGAPTARPGSVTSGIQMYSANVTINGTATSVFHLMNGDAAGSTNAIKLYRQNSMTAPNNVVLTNTDTQLVAVVTNMRTRINQLEQILRNLGILSTPSSAGSSSASAGSGTSSPL